MVTLSDDTVLQFNSGPGGEGNTILVSDLKALIATQSLLQRYENELVSYLSPSSAWIDNQQLSLSIAVEVNPAV